MAGRWARSLTPWGHPGCRAHRPGAMTATKAAATAMEAHWPRIAHMALKGDRGGEAQSRQTTPWDGDAGGGNHAEKHYMLFV